MDNHLEARALRNLSPDAVLAWAKSETDVQKIGVLIDEIVSLNTVLRLMGTGVLDQSPVEELTPKGLTTEEAKAKGAPY